jgi:hemolysin III
MGSNVFALPNPLKGFSSSSLNPFDQPGGSPARLYRPTEEFANTISHGIGLIAALVGAPSLLLAAHRTGSGGFFVGTIVFSLTMSALYLASMLYHAWPQTRGKYVLQVVDHSAIFFLIAGTYTPFALGPLRGAGGPTMLGTVWAIAIFGVLVKVIRGTSRHRKLALSLYLGLGWSALFAVRPIILNIPPGAIIWLVAGGIAYTVGVLFFVNERLRYAHFTWHLFVLAGTSCHFLALFACTV